MEHDSQPKVYCVHVWIQGIHPMLWRRFLVRSDSTLADLHVVLQIGFDWTDFHLHRFRIRKKAYAVPRLGGLSCHDARKITLAELHFRINERFVYEYDFCDLWQHHMRIEKRLVNRSGPLLSGVCGRSMGRATGGLRGSASLFGSARVRAVASQRAARRTIGRRQGPGC
jgi:hypothetical protein